MTNGYLIYPTYKTENKSCPNKSFNVRAYLSRVTYVLEGFDPHRRTNSVGDTGAPITPRWSSTGRSSREKFNHYQRPDITNHILSEIQERKVLETLPIRPKTLSRSGHESKTHQQPL
ncbi:hypothetical protein MA16_Dca027014 [Dendrobium catenatum]|uniref:Uncharacterized protein n=1 Tax=Dendrobium catenatum TaxID=906689 RepID=A0A2I0WXZ4_9ASPA|nr:hypothetical protein MA16_Dca027014 [Dendrobium catenatum]